MVTSEDSYGGSTLCSVTLIELFYLSLEVLGVIIYCLEENPTIYSITVRI